jgi:bacteriocin-like protein
MIADAGFDFTKEELTQVMKTLSDEKLRSVTGGSRPGWFFGSVGCLY